MSVRQMGSMARNKEGRGVGNRAVITELHPKPELF